MQVCDRCHSSIENKKSGVVIADGDVDKEGSPSREYEIWRELCPRCYDKFKVWLKGFIQSGKK